MPIVEKTRSVMQASTKVCEWGTSRAVRIPKRMCDEAGMAIGDNVDMSYGFDERGSFIIIRPETPHRSYGTAPYVPIDDLFRDYDGDYVPEEIDWGEDVGAEVVE